MDRTELLGDVRETLSKAGFYVSELCSIRPIGFDLVARRDNSLLIIKVLTNIDAFSEDVAKELRVLSILLKGCPLLIGERSGTGFLEEDVVYDRFGIQGIMKEDSREIRKEKKFFISFKKDNAQKFFSLVAPHMISHFSYKLP